MAVPNHVLLDRKVVEDRITDILETSLDTASTDPSYKYVFICLTIPAFSCNWLNI